MAQSFKSAISFGLVYVPVTLHSCVKSLDIAFNTLYSKTQERVHYKKTCKNCPAVVNPEDLVRGYQYEKDKYVILTDEEMEKLKTPKEKTVQIERFVKLSEIDPIYYDKSYYIKPTGAENAFGLILKAMEEENKVGIAKTVLGTKEQVVALRAVNKQLVLTTMHFHDEIQPSPMAELKETVNPKELSLAKLVIENMTDKFDMKLFRNTYRDKLMAAIEKKIDGKSISGGKPSVVKPNNVINLFEALQKSVSKTKPKPRAATKTKKVKSVS